MQTARNIRLIAFLHDYFTDIAHFFSRVEFVKEHPNSLVLGGELFKELDSLCDDLFVEARVDIDWQICISVNVLG